jgi:hypothetical protein
MSQAHDDMQILFCNNQNLMLWIFPNNAVWILQIFLPFKVLAHSHKEKMMLSNIPLLPQQAMRILAHSHK